MADDQFWLQHALLLAKHAAQLNEVPVGAVVVLNDEIIGAGYNQPITKQDPTAHAEILALREAALTIGNYRLVGATLYVTLEPCAMCAGSLLHARIKRLVYGARDSKAGAVESQFGLYQLTHNHKVDWLGGVLETQCKEVLQTFFQARR